MKLETGIAALGLCLPPLVMDLDELAKLRQVEADKYKIGLGCQQMALCPTNYTVIDLATTAAERALKHWGKDRKDIGLIVVGTESAGDMSRPLSAWIANRLQIQGAVRSYEVKHACYGGTAALRQAVEWKLSGVAGNKAALVIAADIALYAEKDPGEPTQGAGAVAMIIDEPHIAAIEPQSYPWSEPVFDFWHPLDTPYPLVDGPFSLECYQRAALSCFQSMIQQKNPQDILNEFAAICFHVPFPKMVKKTVNHLAQSFGWDTETTEKFFQQKVDSTMAWNRLCGNAYTGSLWIAVARALSGLSTEEKIAAFSYGSGCGAELVTLTAGPQAQQQTWAADIEKDIRERRAISAEEYIALRKAALQLPAKNT